LNIDLYANRYIGDGRSVSLQLTSPWIEVWWGGMSKSPSQSRRIPAVKEVLKNRDLPDLTCTKSKRDN
jgi:hypothetical protein